jgi:acetate kinase
MYIVTVNVGTASIKAALYEVGDTGTERKKKGKIYPLHPINSCTVTMDVPDTMTIKSSVADIDEAILSLIATICSDIDKNQIVFGVRVVHGGEKLTKPTLITSDVFSYLESIQSLAPLHNPPAMHAISVIKNQYPNIPIWAVFDTAFHTTLPLVASSYAISPNLKNQHIRRFGFHGLAHVSMLNAYIKERAIPKENASIITLQLGSGCSMCAIKNGKSVDTSMGFTPLEGLVSRTRSGSIDPAVIPYLSKKLSEPAEKILEILNKESGLAGMTGTEGQMTDLLKLEAQGNTAAKEAIDLFVYRIQQYMGGYYAVMDGADAVVFAGGITEHCQSLIRRILSSSFFDITLKEQDYELSQPIIKISTDTSKRHAFACLVDEELEIAGEVKTAIENETK